MTLVICPDLEHVSAAYRRWCVACWIASSVMTALLGFMLIFVMLNRSAVLTYGNVGDLWLERGSTRAEVVHGGEALQLVFANTTWLRLCRSEFAAFVQIDGRRFDLPTHRIVPPKHGGKIEPPKSREIKMPLFGDGVTGPARLWAEVSSYCWPTDYLWPIHTTTPDVRFVVE